MPFQLGPRSRKELEGVHPRLVAVVERTVEISEIDFAVHDGLRTPEEQAEYLRTGVSKVKFSKHQVQNDGFGHAVDLVPWINGKLRWEWGPIYNITGSVRAASLELQVPLIWGAVWDRVLDDLPEDPEELRLAVKDYADRHPGPDFLDGPHFELKL